MPDWLSDAFCRVTTDAGFGTRSLYTNAEEELFDGERPVAICGIPDVVRRSDLVDRGIFLTLPQIPEKDRRAKGEFRRAFERDRPYILGAMLDAMAYGLRELPNTKLEQLPRMAEAALWVTACEGAFDWPAGTFVAAYERNRQKAAGGVIEGDRLADVLISFGRREKEWEGSATALLAALSRMCTEEERRSKSWPSAANVLSAKLRRLAPALRRQGLDIMEYERKGRGGRVIWVIRVQEDAATMPGQTSATSATSATDAAGEPASRTSAHRENRRSASHDFKTRRGDDVGDVADVADQNSSFAEPDPRAERDRQSSQTSDRKAHRDNVYKRTQRHQAY
jgi:hypothetical protein